MYIDNFLIDENKNLLDAMRQFDNIIPKILLVMRNDTFIATLTDGDMRRYLISGGNLKDPLTNIANYSPRYVLVSDKNRASEIMVKTGLFSIPVINSSRKVVDIIFSDERYSVHKHDELDLPVVVMAGGKGTRLYPYTKVLPKPLMPIGELPIAEHIINKFYEFGCKQFNFIVNHQKNMIKAYFSETDKDITFYEEEVPLGTGGGLNLLKGKITKTFFLTNCDIILKEDYSDIYKYHVDNKNSITMVCAYKHLVVPYGVINMSNSGGIESFIEKPEYSFLTNTGFYVVEPDILSELKENEAIGFPDIVINCRNKGYNIGVYPVSEKSWLDMGQLEEMENMKRQLGV